MINLKNFALSCVLALSPLFFVQAQDNAEATEKEKIAPDTVSATIQMASNLVTHGVAEQNPLLLLSAAQILVKTPVSSFALEEGENSSEHSGAKKSNDAGIELKPAVLLAKAKEMATGNDHLLALIDDTSAKLPKEEVVERGAKYGRVYTTRTVSARRNYSFYITYRGGYRANLSIIGDGDTDLDFYIYDSRGNLVGSDTDYSDQAYFYWTPRYDTRYRVKVVNRGNVYNVFRVISN